MKCQQGIIHKLINILNVYMKMRIPKDKYNDCEINTVYVKK